MVLLLASVFCLRQTQVFTSEPKFVYKNKLPFLILATQNAFYKCFFYLFVEFSP